MKHIQPQFCHKFYDNEYICYIEMQELPTPPKENILQKATLGDWANAGIFLIGIPTLWFLAQQWKRYNPRALLGVQANMMVVTPGVGITSPGPHLMIKTTNIGEKPFHITGHYVAWYKTRFHRFFRRPAVKNGMLMCSKPYTTIHPGSSYTYFELEKGLMAMDPKLAMYIGVGYNIQNTIDYKYMKR